MSHWIEIYLPGASSDRLHIHNTKAVVGGESRGHKDHD